MRVFWSSLILVCILAQTSLRAAEAKPAKVEHSPERPRSGEAVRITISTAGATGTSAPTLQYQIVDPGGYIEANDPAYRNNWVSLAMNAAASQNDSGEF